MLRFFLLHKRCVNLITDSRGQLFDKQTEWTQEEFICDRPIEWTNNSRRCHVPHTSARLV